MEPLMAVKKLASGEPTYFYSMPVADVRGLDPKLYRVSLSVDRLDHQPLADAECELIEQVFASLATGGQAGAAQGQPSPPGIPPGPGAPGAAPGAGAKRKRRRKAPK
jgi:hypothetical protein